MEPARDALANSLTGAGYGGYLAFQAEKVV